MSGGRLLIILSMALSLYFLVDTNKSNQLRISELEHRLLISEQAREKAEAVLSQQKALQESIQKARNEREQQLHELANNPNDDLFNKLRRMLDEDQARRKNSDQPAASLAPALP